MCIRDRYLVRMQAMTEVSDTERLEIFRLHEVVSNIERIGDHAENIAEYTLDCKMNDSKSISYTHLDVYKRQMQNDVYGRSGRRLYRNFSNAGR